MSDIRIAGSSIKRGGPISTIPKVLPAAVVAGALRDHLAPFHMSEYLAEHIPGAQVIALEGNHIRGIVSMGKIIEAVLSGIQ